MDTSAATMDLDHEISELRRKLANLVRKRDRARGADPERRDGIVVLDVWKAKGRQEGKRWLARAWDSRRRKYRCKAYDDRDEAEAWATEERSRLALGLSSAGRLTLPTIKDAYVEELNRRGRSEHHVGVVRSVLDEANEAGVGDVKGDGFRDAVRRWLAAEKELSPRSRNKRLVILHGAIRFALGEGMLLTDPLIGVRGETEKAAGKLREVFTPAELTEIVSDKHRDHAYWPEACALVYLGLRVGEAAALEWRWFDFAGGVVSIKQTDDFSPKRHQERTIPLMAEAADLFRPMAALAGKVSRRQLEEPGSKLPLKARKSERTPAVVAAERASRAFADYLADIGLDAKGRGAHCVRHSWVSLRLALGVPSLVVQRQAGHRTILTTEKYSHAIPAGWIEGWPKDGTGEFWLRREPPKPAEATEPKQATPKR